MPVVYLLDSAALAALDAIANGATVEAVLPTLTAVEVDELPTLD